MPTELKTRAVRVFPLQKDSLEQKLAEKTSEIVANEITDDVRAKQSAFGIISRQEFDRAEPVIFILPVRSNLMLSVHTKTD